MLTAAVDHVDRLVKARLDELARQAISNFQEIRTDAKLSGDDSPLENVWEEFKYQVQIEESFYWDAYEETFLGICGPMCRSYHRSSSACSGTGQKAMSVGMRIAMKSRPTTETILWMSCSDE